MIFTEEDPGRWVNLAVHHIILPEHIEHLVSIADHRDDFRGIVPFNVRVPAHEAVEHLTGDPEGESEGRDGRFNRFLLAVIEILGDPLIDLIRVMDVNFTPGKYFEPAFGKFLIFIAVDDDLGIFKGDGTFGLNIGQIEFRLVPLNREILRRHNILRRASKRAGALLSYNFGGVGFM